MIRTRITGSNIFCAILVSFWTNRTPASGDYHEGDPSNEPDEELDAIGMDIIRREIQRTHEANILVLEMDCFLKDCPFSRAKQIISDVERTTEYWTYLNCVKYGKTCPRNGKWGSWGKYEPCSARCGAGFMVRWRDCNKPYPMYGGLKCAGVDHEVAACQGNEDWKCAPNPSIPGVWSSWGPWSHCNGQRRSRGFRTRKRKCLPNLKEEECEAYPRQQVPCRRGEVDVDGGWSHWGTWSECTTKYTCGAGVKIRKRSCSNPHKSGSGSDCLGASSETTRCFVRECEQDIPTLAHFLPDSFLQYRSISPSYYLHIYLKFMPHSDNGLLFQYSSHGALQEATKSGSVKITKPKIHKFVNVQQKEDVEIEVKIEQDKAVSEDEDYIYALLRSSTDCEIHINLNGSEKITVPLHGVRSARWNELRLSVVSDMIWTRLNDGENIEVRMEDFLENNVQNGTEVIAGYITRITDSIKSLFNPSSRQIFTRFDGEVGLGAVRQGFEGFRGYVSHFAVNHKFFSLRLKPKSKIRTALDPFRGNRINLGSGRLGRLSLQTYFNGRQAVKLPLKASWAKQMSPNELFGRTEGELATFELLIMPECDDGLFFFIRSAKNPFTHWKLSVDARRSIRLAMSYGGKVTLLKSGMDLHPGRWNRVILQLVRAGHAHLEVNGRSYYQKMPDAVEEHSPHSIVYVGGFGKAIEHDVLLGKDPTPELKKEFKSFEGYIYSVKQNTFLYLLQDLPQVNTFHMLSSGFVARTNIASTVLFLPTSTDKAENSNRKDLLGWEDHTEHRALLCSIPIPEDIRYRPNVSWYRNDRKVEESSSHWTDEYISENSHIATLYFGKSVDSSLDHSGIYQCVMSYFPQSFVATTFAVVVLPEDIAHLAVGGLGRIFRGYSMESAIFMIAGFVVGALILLLVIVSCIRRVIGKIVDWKKETVERAKESTSLSKLDHSSSSHESDSSWTPPKNQTASSPKFANRFKTARRLSSSKSQSSSPTPSFLKVVDTTRKVKQLSKKLTKKVGRGERVPLLKSSDSDSEYEQRTVVRMGSIVKVKQKKKTRTTFENKSTGHFL